MEENHDKILEMLGLAKNERKVYLDVVKNGTSSALAIAKRTGIHRTNVYDALRQLDKKGFIAEAVEENKRLFLARDPKAITEYVFQLNREVDAMITDLQFTAKKQPEREAESVTLAKGTFAIRTALLELLEIGEPLYISGASREALDAFGMSFLADFHKKRLSKKIPMYHIYHQDMPQRINHLNKMKYTEARFLPRKYDSLVSTAICGDTVLLIILSKPVSLIKIKNKEIAKTYVKYFNILWTKSTL